MTSSTTENPVEIISFKGVCVWKTSNLFSSKNQNNNSNNELLCAICRSDISDFCVECAMTVAHGPVKLLPHQQKAQQQNDDETNDNSSSSSSSSKIVKCHVAAGRCNHMFHKHCLSGWLKSHSVCPLCQDPWDQVGGDLDRSALM